MREQGFGLRSPERTFTTGREGATTMAQKKVVALIDDLDGSTAVETVQFTLDGTHYEIDLSADNATALRSRLASFVDSARRLGRSGRAGRRGRAAGAGRQPAARRRAEDSAAIRDWARQQGYTISDRGRLSANVVDAYRKAH
jgi:hypothetical protein